MIVEGLAFKSLLTASKRYDLIAEDEIEIKVNGTMILKVQVPEDEKWFVHISVNAEVEKV